jgi:hypothetical protein
MTRSTMLRLLLCGGLALPSALPAGEAPLAADARRLQGLFCNTEAQIDRAREEMAKGRHPRSVAERLNRDAVVCTYVDRLHFLIVGARLLGEALPPKYRGSLVAVDVGDARRPVSPPVELYFLIPEPLPGARAEHDA